MALKKSDEIKVAFHNAMIASVKTLVSAHDYAKNVWLNYCHINAPCNDHHNTVCLDPARYSVTMGAIAMGNTLSDVKGATPPGTFAHIFPYLHKVTAHARKENRDR